MSISFGSGGASGMGASSSSSDACAMAQSTGSSGAGSSSMCLEKSSSRAWSGPRLVLVAQVRAVQLLKLRKTATSQGCKYDVLCGGMKHSTM